METFEQIFLQIIHDACTNKTSSIAIAPQDMDALLALVKDQSCVPYVLPYLNDKSRLEPLKYQTKLMILNYYQIDQFTRRIAALFEVNQIPYDSKRMMMSATIIKATFTHFLKLAEP